MPSAVPRSKASALYLHHRASDIMRGSYSSGLTFWCEEGVGLRDVTKRFMLSPVCVLNIKHGIRGALHVEVLLEYLSLIFGWL